MLVPFQPGCPPQGQCCVDSAPTPVHAQPNAPASADEGYMLLGLIVAIAILLLWLSVAATHEAFAIRRERDVETARRADQYVRAIRLYYLKFGHYPGSLEQLEQTNNIRFLRRRWIDPLTGTTDWRIIAVGQNKSTPRGFFGQPLAGLPTTGIGAPIAGAQSPATPGAAPAAAGSAVPGAPAGLVPGTPGFSLGSVGLPAASTPAAGGASATSPPSAFGGAPSSFGAPAPSSTGQPGSTSAAGSSTTASSGQSTTGAFMGVGTNATGNSVLEVNGQNTYQNWEFLYDPRVEQLRRAQQLNTGLPTAGTGSFGQAPAAGGFGQPSAPAQPSSPGGFSQPSAPGGFGLPAGSSAPPPPDPNQPAAPVIGAPLRP